jgi:hypothetical protein
VVARGHAIRVVIRSTTEHAAKNPSSLRLLGVCGPLNGIPVFTRTALLCFAGS